MNSFNNFLDNIDNNGSRVSVLSGDCDDRWCRHKRDKFERKFLPKKQNGITILMNLSKVAKDIDECGSGVLEKDNPILKYRIIRDDIMLQDFFKFSLEIGKCKKKWGFRGNHSIKKFDTLLNIYISNI